MQYKCKIKVRTFVDIEHGEVSLYYKPINKIFFKSLVLYSSDCYSTVGVLSAYDFNNAVEVLNEMNVQDLKIYVKDIIMKKIFTTTGKQHAYTEKIKNIGELRSKGTFTIEI